MRDAQIPFDRGQRYGDYRGIDDEQELCGHEQEENSRAGVDTRWRGVSAGAARQGAHRSALVGLAAAVAACCLGDTRAVAAPALSSLPSRGSLRPTADPKAYR